MYAYDPISTPLEVSALRELEVEQLLQLLLLLLLLCGSFHSECFIFKQ